MVNAIQEEMMEVVNSSEAGSQEVSTGITVVNQANGAFERIQKEIEEVGAQIVQVSLQSSDISHKSQTALEVIRSIEAVAKHAASGNEMYRHILKSNTRAWKKSFPLRIF